MKTIRVHVPLRADLAGGTLDLWPLYLFHPGSRTINVAISFHAECEVSRAADESKIELLLTDQQYEKSYDSISEVLQDPHAALVARALEHFKLTGIRIVTRTDAPRGSGLGGSSALAVAMIRALSEFAGNPVEGEPLIELVRDLETRLLGVPAGVQDYYPPVFGGLMSLHLDPGKITRHPLQLPISELTRHLVLHYSEVQRFSGTNNWEIYKRHIDGDQKIIEGLSRIAESARELEQAIERHNLRAAGKALQQEWENRKALIDGISTPEIDAAIAAARAAGAWGGKVCGAGGGGSIVFLVPVKKKEAVRAALANAPGQTLKIVPVSYGLNIDVTDEARAPLTFAPRRGSKKLRSYEQLYQVGSGSGRFLPHVFAEGRITYDEPRSGFHTTVATSLLVPIDLHTERLEWDRAVEVRADDLQMNAATETPLETLSHDQRESLIAAVTEGEEFMPQQFAERARLPFHHNPSFNLWSEPGETLAHFTRRCLERATQILEQESERLESTFRRRMDQMREKSERESREENQAGRPKELNIAWGQALYNITAGKEVSTRTPESVDQADYMGRIAQLQKQWEREREQKREELETTARAIVEITLTPSPRNVEVVRYLILWSAAEEKRDGRAQRARNGSQISDLG